jgi:hypothetical protein
MDGFIQNVDRGSRGSWSARCRSSADPARDRRALDHALPGGLLAGVLFVALAVSAWQLAKR